MKYHLRKQTDTYRLAEMINYGRIFQVILQWKRIKFTILQSHSQNLYKSVVPVYNSVKFVSH